MVAVLLITSVYAPNSPGESSRATHAWATSVAPIVVKRAPADHAIAPVTVRPRRSIFAGSTSTGRPGSCIAAPYRLPLT